MFGVELQRLLRSSSLRRVSKGARLARSLAPEQARKVRATYMCMDFAVVAFTLKEAFYHHRPQRQSMPYETPSEYHIQDIYPSFLMHAYGTTYKYV